MTGTTKAGEGPITIKKYANRRLYNTATSSYVTLDHLCDMVKEGVEFSVFDAKTGEDITRSVLTQIIFEEEGKGQNLMPIRFLRQLIQFYGDSLQSLIPSYLELSMEGISRNAEKFRDQLTQALGGPLQAKSGFGMIEEMTRRNVQLFQRAMRAFSPFASRETPASEAASEATTGSTNGKDAHAKPAETEEIAELRAQVEAMRRQLDALSNRK
ncbi:MAG TPA: polyhydroxyalkanoate synthesis repressor PhaR [Micropepsaceae bacterium]|nr:polyhydroxyalkanoate synthesis repressor PhaR [Micropepsaceae bacterium]HRK71670.1 polyhydroxyalkanoate synthesis repressor PhaR [Micropepsaceae bacterium]